jgi:energy-coupling factor transport system permease protein
MTYQRLASPLHAARAEVAAAWCMALGAAALIFEHPLILGALLAIVVAGAIAAGVGRPVGSALRYGIPFALAIALVNPLVVREGLTVLLRFGEIPPFGQVDVTLEAVAYGGLLGLRVFVVLLASVVATFTVDPDEVLRVFRRISFRSALTAALAVRLVPVLQRDGRRLAEARRCRADGGGEGAAARLAVLRAVAAGALDRAADVAATLEVRGYGGARRAPRSRRPWSRHDFAFAASALGIVALVVAAAAGGVAELEAYPRLVTRFGPAELALAAALAAVALLPFADRRGIEP